jgi:hypothetical protein
MTERKSDDGSEQLNFDTEKHKQELEKRLQSRIEKARPAELIRAQLEHLRDSASGAESTDFVPITEKRESSTPSLIEWARSRGLLPNKEETEGEYISRIRLAKYKTKLNRRETINTSGPDGADQGHLF